MDYQAFTNGSLTMMYEAVLGALAAADVADAPRPAGAAQPRRRSYCHPRLERPRASNQR